MKAANVAVCTDARSPRKHAHALCHAPKFRVVLGDGVEDRAVEAFWYDNDNGINASFSIDVATLRAMLAEAEAYKPGATRGSPNPKPTVSY